MAIQKPIREIFDSQNRCIECTMLELVFMLSPMVDSEEKLVKIISEMVNTRRARLTGSFQDIEIDL